MTAEEKLNQLLYERRQLEVQRDFHQQEISRHKATLKATENLLEEKQDQITGLLNSDGTLKDPDAELCRIRRLLIAESARSGEIYTEENVAELEYRSQVRQANEIAKKMMKNYGKK